MGNNKGNNAPCKAPWQFHDLPVHPQGVHDRFHQSEQVIDSTSLSIRYGTVVHCSTFHSTDNFIVSYAEYYVSSEILLGFGMVS